MTPADIRDYFGNPASQIAERHWQSGFPVPFTDLSKHGVDVVVLASAEAQPDLESILHLKRVCPGLVGIRCPFDDTSDSAALPGIVRIAQQAANRVVEYLAQGKTVLVTCSAGRNRSGLISALALMKRYGISGREAVARVRAGRDPSMPPGEGALSNWRFAAYLSELPAP